MDTQRGRRGRTRLLAVTWVAAMIGALLPLGLSTTASAAYGDTIDVGSITLEGCNNDVGTSDFTLPDGNGNFICPDARYTTGNMGKGWAELDLVPHRVTLENGKNSGSEAGSFLVAGDYKNGAGTATGWDYISELTLNDALSADSCPAVISGDLTITDPGEGAGGADQTIYRQIDVPAIPADPNAKTTCVYDYYQRLALGAHLFSGSSLQSNLWNPTLGAQGIGEKRIQLPVGDILPQELRKDMTAVRGTDHVWNVTKDATPTALDFGDTCAVGATLSTTVSVTINWTKGDAVPAGTAVVTTNIYAKNPASRAITVTVQDKIYAGTDQTTLLDTKNFAPLAVPAGTEVLVGTHMYTWANPGTSVNDVATGSYTDTVTNLPIPQTTTAKASATVQNTGTEANATAAISDTESLTNDGGGHLEFAVATPLSGSFVSPDGGVTPAYVAGTHTTGPVVWSSGSVSSGGSVTFNKTVYLDEPAIVTGRLADTASLVGSSGATASASLSVDIASSATSSFTITKTIPNILQGTESATFSFKLFANGADSKTATPLDTKSVTFVAGDTSKTVTFTGLVPATAYDVYETAPTGWVNPGKQDITTATLPLCSAGTTIENTYGPATAKVVKVTDPAGNEAGWDFTLTGPGIPVGGETVTTVADDPNTPNVDETGLAIFGASLQEGSYTITEVTKDGWDADKASCTFTVNYPADFDKVFSCTFTNTKRGEIDLTKLFNNATPTAGQTFTFSLRTGASQGVAGTIVTPPGTVTLSQSNNWAYNWTNLVPGTYQLCESNVPVGGHSSIENMTGWFSTGTSPNDNSTVCVPVVVGAGSKVIISVNDTPPPGGDTRTIGYWKNWSSCASNKGKQKWVLDQTMAKGAITIGNITLSAALNPDGSAVDCQKAVRLLNKSSINTGTKLANDPAYNLAAQLLAAKLNVQAGAKSCPVVSGPTGYITTAQDLLVAVNFTGVYTDKSHPGHGPISQSQASQMNYLAKQLDKYNNNVYSVCP